MKIEYAYHIKVDKKVIFLGSKLRVQLIGVEKVKEGILDQIGPKGIYLKTPTRKNTEFINYKIINSMEVIV